MQEPLNLLGKQRFANIDIRVRAKGGGHVSQAYGGQGRLLCQLPTHGHVLLACCSDSSRSALRGGASCSCLRGGIGAGIIVCLHAVLHGRRAPELHLHPVCHPSCTAFYSVISLLLRLAGSHCPPVVTK